MKKKILLFLVCLFSMSYMHCQITKDAGMWNTFSIEKEFSDKFSVAVDEEFRLKENFSMLNLFYTNLGVNYKFGKGFKVSLTYRLTEKWKYKIQDFSYRHRLMFDLSYKYNAYRWSLIYRSRVQSELIDTYTSELGKLPEWFWRNKIDIKYKIGNYTPYIGAEFRYQITDPRNPEFNNGWHRVRTFAGIDYEINNRNTLGLYYLVQQEFDILAPEYIYIVGIQYKIEIKH